MQTPFPILVKLSLIFAPFWLTGCASDEAIPVVTKPEPIISGDTMLRESQGMANLSERWQAGKRLVDRGTAMVSDGEAKITEGNRLIDEGNKIIRESEEHYKNIKQ